MPDPLERASALESVEARVALLGSNYDILKRDIKPFTRGNGDLMQHPWLPSTNENDHFDDEIQRIPDDPENDDVPNRPLKRPRNM